MILSPPPPAGVTVSPARAEENLDCHCRKQNLAGPNDTLAREMRVSRVRVESRG